MAFLKLHTGKYVSIKPEKAVSIWEVLIGEREGTEEQQAFVATVERVYMNYPTAPLSYQQAYPRHHLSDPSAAVADIVTRRAIRKDIDG